MVGMLAERQGFEPWVRTSPTHALQACPFGRSGTSPEIGENIQSTVYMKEEQNKLCHYTCNGAKFSEISDPNILRKYHRCGEKARNFIFIFLDGCLNTCYLNIRDSVKEG